MFELFFGGAFVGISFVFTVVLLGVAIGGGEPFFLLPLLFIVPFWIIGITCMRQGIRKIRANQNTKQLGRDSFGLVLDFKDPGRYVNGYPVWDVRVLVVTETGVRTFTESAGTNPPYDVGDYLSVRYYDNDINILHRTHANSVPEDIKQRLEAGTPMTTRQKINEYKRQNQDFIVEGDYLIIDGVKYKRPPQN